MKNILMTRLSWLLFLLFLSWDFYGLFADKAFSREIKIPDTGQTQCYNNSGEIKCPNKDRPFYGQDAQYQSHPMSYRDNQDGTVTDLSTGLMWSKSVEKNKSSLSQARKTAEKITLGGFSDWRVPNIKELYSLINFSGNTGMASKGRLEKAIPFLNTDYFDFRYGNTDQGERYIDAQWLSSTQYVSTTMNGVATLFGVNFADGRIKGYGYGRSGPSRRPEKKFFVRYVRGNPYGQNNFEDNNDGTVTDHATGLMWTKTDSGRGMDWEAALAYAENTDTAGFDDWRLPNAKELQYIVDYTRSPDTTQSAAIHPVFRTTKIQNEAGRTDYPYFWSSTTHLEGPFPGRQGVYISFGRAMGQMRNQNMDVHGAGAQRSDPKTGRGNYSRGPQGDWVRVNNYVRLVRGGKIKKISTTPEQEENKYPGRLRIISDSESTDFNPNSEDSSNKKIEKMGFPPPFKPGSPEPKQQESAIAETNPFIKRLDKNGDNKVSPDEFDGPAHHFSRFDLNKDGYISPREAPTGPPPGKKPVFRKEQKP